MSNNKERVSLMVLTEPVRVTEKKMNNEDFMFTATIFYPHKNPLPNQKILALKGVRDIAKVHEDTTIEAFVSNNGDGTFWLEEILGFDKNPRDNDK